MTWILRMHRNIHKLTIQIKRESEEWASVTQTQYATNEIKQIVKIVLEIGEKTLGMFCLKTMHMLKMFQALECGMETFLTTGRVRMELFAP